MEKIPQNQTEVSITEIKAEGENKIEELKRKIKELTKELHHEENIEASKLEWGPLYNAMTMDRAREELYEINRNLKEGEKPWRFPTEDEIVFLFNRVGLTPEGFYNKGFRNKGDYWATTKGQANLISVSIVSGKSSSNDSYSFTRFVR